MLAKRIIPCLDVKDGLLLKGTNFTNLRDAGDAVELAKIYSNQGADELIFLDITATNEKTPDFERIGSTKCCSVPAPPEAITGNIDRFRNHFC